MNQVLAVLPPETGGDGGEGGTSSLGESPAVITAIFFKCSFDFLHLGEDLAYQASHIRR